MNRVSAEEVRTVLLKMVDSELATRKLKAEEIPDNFDLLTEGVIDSMGILRLITEIESHFGIHVDFEDLDPEYLTIVGHLCRYFARKSSTNNTNP